MKSKIEVFNKKIHSIKYITEIQFLNNHMHGGSTEIYFLKCGNKKGAYQHKKADTTHTQNFRFNQKRVKHDDT